MNQEEIVKRELEKYTQEQANGAEVTRYEMEIGAKIKISKSFCLGLLSWLQDQEGKEVDGIIVRRCVTNILVTLFKMFTNIISKYILLLFPVMLTHI